VIILNLQVHLRTLASHSHACRVRAPRRGLAWQREAASPSRLHSLQTRVWHPWTCPEALPLRYRSRAFAPLRTSDEELSRPFDHSPGLSCPGTHSSEPSGSDTLTGAFVPLRPRPVFRHRLRQKKGLDPFIMRARPEPVWHDRGCKSLSGPGNHYRNHWKKRSRPMTTPSPTVAAARPWTWDENRWREALRSRKPFSPKVQATLEHLYKCIMAYVRAHAEYQFEAAMSGAPDVSRLRVTARRLEKARHEALTALGQDPTSADVLGFVAPIPHDA
jgi:hypothetical protein